MEVLRSLRTVDGATLGYRLYREPATTRRLIVLLHGVASNMTRWSEFVEQTILTKSWDVLRPDLRGHGESFSRGTLNLEIWCKDLRDILDAEGYDQALLIGHSLGAQVAIQFAARYPARVTALAIIDPVFHVALRGGLPCDHRSGLSRGHAWRLACHGKIAVYFPDTDGMHPSAEQNWPSTADDTRARFATTGSRNQEKSPGYGKKTGNDRALLVTVARF